MKVPAEHPNELARLTALRSLHILDTEPSQRFDRLSRMALRLLDVPIALISLVDQDRQWFKSNFGLKESEMSRDISFCGHVVADDQVLVVSDTLEDERFSDNPLVTGDPQIRFYAGVPIHADGLPIGTLCAIDTKPREYAPEDVAALSDLARLIEDELARDEDMFLDELTGLLSRRGLEAIGTVIAMVAARTHREVAAAFGDLDGLKSINDTYGHAEGDRALIEIAGIFSGSFRRADAVARLSGDEFCVLIMAGEGSTSGVEAPLQRFSSALEERNAQSGRLYPLSMSIGTAVATAHLDFDLDELLAQADANMYDEKMRRRNDLRIS